jgi:hypothetical protein
VRGHDTSSSGSVASASASARRGINNQVNTDVPTRTASRSAAISDLFAALDALMIHYGTLPEAERQSYWSADADRITGEIARQLHAARHRISGADPATSARS